MQALRDLFSQPPASFAWSSSEDGRRTIGTAPGAIIDIWEDHVELAAIFPPDNAELAARNGTLLLLLLTALRKDWITAPDWLRVQMGMAAKAKDVHEGVHYGRGVRFTWYRRGSRALLRVRR